MSEDEREIPAIDGYSFGRLVPLADDPQHLEGCEAQMIEKEGVEVTGVCRCVVGCPSREASIVRGRELAKEHGWDGHFEAFDDDGDGLRIGPPGEYAEREYQALLAVDNGAMFLRRDQVEALRDFLTGVLDG